MATLLTRTDLSPRRVELLGVAWREEAEALARQQVEGGARLTPDESARRVELGLLHGNAALVLRACGPSWPKGAVPAVVAWSLIRVVAEAADQVGYIAGRRLHHGRNGEHAAGSVSTAPRGAPPLKTGASTTMLLP
ncbi:MAG: hypothetical protein KIT58_10535 [Planctomycetota bacterium]|nr:hypothetical protein [Planctomycetota bacterium]